jgi:hypothetical protein
LLTLIDFIHLYLYNFDTKNFTEKRSHAADIAQCAQNHFILEKEFSAKQFAEPYHTFSERRKYVEYGNM